MPDALSHTNARLLALISTGRVTKLNNVVMANRMIPANKIPGMVLIRNIPAKMTHVTHCEANDTTGTRELRSCNGA